MTVCVSVEFLRVGHTRQAEKLARVDGSWRKMDFPACCALIAHPTRGPVLYDTGYAPRFFEETARYPLKLYRDLLPVWLPEAETLTAQLSRRGLAAADIWSVVLSHFHGDHIAGLKDFPNADLYCLRADYEEVIECGHSRWHALFAGFAAGLLPPDFAARAIYADDLKRVDLPQWMHPFDSGFDLLGDGSIIGVPLPGHSAGQLGLLLPETQYGPVFLVADACWSLPACLSSVLPAGLAMHVQSSPSSYRDTFSKLGVLARREPTVHILPSHCACAREAFCAR